MSCRPTDKARNMTERFLTMSAGMFYVATGINAASAAGHTMNGIRRTPDIWSYTTCSPMPKVVKTLKRIYRHSVPFVTTSFTGRKSEIVQRLDVANRPYRGLWVTPWFLLSFPRGEEEHRMSPMSFPDVIRFLDPIAADGWYHSPAYQALIPLGEEAVEMVLVSYES